MEKNYTYNLQDRHVTFLLSGFFLIAALWPDFTELSFLFRFWLKLVISPDFWILLVPKKAISKLSGNTVRSTHQSFFKNLFDIGLFTEN